MAVILYGPSLALSQVTGLNIWIAVGLCGIVFIIYTSIRGIKAVTGTDVIEASLIFIGLTISTIIDITDAGETSKLYKTVKVNNRLQFSVVDFDPSIRYTMWNIFISVIFSSTAQYACIQTQAQRYMSGKDTKVAQKVVWTNYIMLVSMHILCLWVGCLLYNKYSQCDRLRTKIIS
ncbi:unnamed protein product [Adineta steineri]|uniref:Uncharacterized protein n=1 Tax=Adineta steineri TaxID=433720 RepID=A0A816H0E1_9BILA|nr:unnamed protein product [Adineta steineri]CAF1680758.1 unnamed protein product [Adineta steineri]